MLRIQRILVMANAATAGWNASNSLRAISREDAFAAALMALLAIGGLIVTNWLCRSNWEEAA